MTRAARPLVLAILGFLVAALLSVVAAPARAATLVPISGAGSTWSQNALDQWRRNVNQFGMRVNFQGTGSSDGRNQFKNGTVDFAVSEIPYGLVDNGVTDPAPERGFAYMPIVAGGTSFMYNLKAGGKRITNLRLTGEQLTKIFTGVITRWDDATVKAENPGLDLPPRPIVPVVRSDGSGTSAQFTLWMATQYSQLWNDFCGKNKRTVPCGQTSNYPAPSSFRALAGSLGVAGYVSQDANEGTITYVEESYALNTGFPVVKLLNKAGYYVEPNASNVAVALQGAQINPDLTQKLDGVYNNDDKRAYPLSSYSYMIMPTKVEGPITEDKGFTLASFAHYFLCAGQQAAPELGYSPLPRVLVQAGLDVVQKVPGHEGTQPEADCLSKSDQRVLAENAPFPSECDKQGSAAQCTEGTGGAGDTPTQNQGGGQSQGDSTTAQSSTGTNSGQGSGGSTDQGGGAGSTGDSGAGGTGTTGEGGTGDAGSTAGTGATGVTGPSSDTGGVAGVVDPDTGQVVPGTGGTGGTSNPGGAGTASSGAIAGVPVALDTGAGSGFSSILIVFAVLLLGALVVGPPLAARRVAPRPGPDA